MSRFFISKMDPDTIFYVIGDLHGDLENFQKILVQLKLVDSVTHEWIRQDKQTVIIQMGDQVDGCRTECRVSDNTNDVDLLKYIQSLEKSSNETNNCKILSLLGNHELMNIIYKNYTFVSRQNKQDRDSLFSRGGKIAKYFAKYRYSSIQIGDWLFVHGGVSPRSHSLDLIEYVAKNYLLDAKFHHDDADTIFTHITRSIFWNREMGYGHDKTKTKTKTIDKCKVLMDFLRTKYGVTKMVISHSVQPDSRITAVCNGSVFRVDTGISRAFKMESKKKQVMQIQNGGKRYKFVDVDVLT